MNSGLSTQNFPAFAPIAKTISSFHAGAHPLLRPMTTLTGAISMDLVLKMVSRNMLPHSEPVTNLKGGERTKHLVEC